ncbi:MAG: hypothetical protein KDA43_07100, partial [Hyphomonas sp.]|nr:hypothetical protein [Hyphomonas sp.]
KGLRAEPMDGAPQPYQRREREDRPERSDRPAPYLRKKAYDPDAPRDFSGKKPYKKKSFPDDAPPAAREPSPQTDYIQDDRKKPYKSGPKTGKKPSGKPAKARTDGGWQPPMKVSAKRPKPATKKPAKGPKKARKTAPRG